MTSSEIADNQTDAAELWDQANKLVDNGEAHLGFLTMLKALEMGSMDSYCSLGYFFDHGIGTPVDHKKALELYKKSYSKGAARGISACNIGLTYRDIYHNIDRAELWLRRSLDAGSPEAGVELAKLYIFNCRKPRKKKAVELLKTAIAVDEALIIEDVKEEAKKLLALIEREKAGQLGENG
jgi:TPR repeat protein